MSFNSVQSTMTVNDSCANPSPNFSTLTNLIIRQKSVINIICISVLSQLHSTSRANL